MAEGHLYDDMGLWQELCELLDRRGLVSTEDLKAHLAPLVFSDPENFYLAWLRENYLVPILHIKGRASQGGNGWRLLRDWRDRLAVMRNPTPDNLLRWWRKLEPVLHRTSITRKDNVVVTTFDATFSNAEPFRFEKSRVVSCTLCKCGARGADPRGIPHAWTRMGSRVDCPMLRLHLMIREADGLERPDHPANSLLAELQRTGEHFACVGDEEDAQAVSGDNIARGGHGIVAKAAYHIAQLCAVWTEPTAGSIQLSAQYLRAGGNWQWSKGQGKYFKRIRALYLDAAERLDALLVEPRPS